MEQIMVAENTRINNLFFGGGGVARIQENMVM